MIYEYYEEWYIKEDGFSIWAYTSMDKFNLKEFIHEEVGFEWDDMIEIGDIWGDLFESEEYEEYMLKIRSEKAKNYQII